jgi:hypothetical protein
MSAELTARDLVEEMRLIADRLAEARDELCRLDGVIGDGDHGVAMADGFAAAAKAASLLDPESATLVGPTLCDRAHASGEERWRPSRHSNRRGSRPCRRDG